jgi:triphosphatase
MPVSLRYVPLGDGVAASSVSTPRPRDELEVEWQFDALDLRPVERWLAALPARAQAASTQVGTEESPPVGGSTHESSSPPTGTDEPIGAGPPLRSAPSDPWVESDLPWVPPSPPRPADLVMRGVDATRAPGHDGAGSEGSRFGPHHALDSGSSASPTTHTGFQSDLGMPTPSEQKEFTSRDATVPEGHVEQEPYAGEIPDGLSDVGRLTTLARPGRRLVDRYLDTPDWRMARAGFVLRVRHRGRHDEVTIKDAHPASSTGLRTRLEVTQELPGGVIERLQPDGPVARRLRAVIGQRSLRQVIEVRTRRRPFSLRMAGADVAEVALDDTTILGGEAAMAGERPVRLRRVEVEVDPAWVQDLEPIVEDLVATTGLRPASLSKFEVGMLGLGLTIPGPPDLGPVVVSPTSTIGDVGLAAVRRHLGALIAHEPGARLGEDPEELHDMRVATRRLRAALDIFSAVLPPRAQMSRRELSWVGRLLGAVRDLDVQIAHHELDAARVASLLHDITRPAPLEPLLTLLRHERDEARRQLIEALDSDRYERLVASLTTMVTGGAGRPPESRQMAVAVLPDLVTERHRPARKARRKALRSGTPTDLHKLRIKCKRLRYSVEFSAGIYGSAAERYVRRLTKVQDLLGLLQDSDTNVRKLYSLAVSTTNPLPAETVYAMGAISGFHRADAESVTSRIKRQTDKIDGQAWHQLARQMERRRTEAVGPGPAVGHGPAVGPGPAVGHGPAAGTTPPAHGVFQPWRPRS